MIDGNAVKRARQAAQLTQAGLAKAAGMAAQTVAAIEQGRLKWTKFLPQLARVLNKTLGELDPDWGAFDTQCRTVQPARRDPGSRKRLDADYAAFAAEILRIRTKSGAIRRSSSTARRATSMPRSRRSAKISAASAR
jgi:transcriptional regulator with XRE-family HTH domain